MKIGTVVWLKSGGPAMTVSYQTNTGVFCIWFLEGKVTGSELSEETLTTENPN